MCTSIWVGVNKKRYKYFYLAFQLRFSCIVMKKFDFFFFWNTVCFQCTTSTEVWKVVTSNFSLSDSEMKVFDLTSSRISCYSYKNGYDEKFLMSTQKRAQWESSEYAQRTYVRTDTHNRAYLFVFLRIWYARSCVFVRIRAYAWYARSPVRTYAQIRTNIHDRTYQIRTNTHVRAIQNFSLLKNSLFFWVN